MHTVILASWIGSLDPKLETKLILQLVFLVLLFHSGQKLFCFFFSRDSTLTVILRCDNYKDGIVESMRVVKEDMDSYDFVSPVYYIREF